MASSVNETFGHALAAFQAGKAHDAERLFKKLLAVQPKHVAGLNLLSILLTQLGKFEEAEHYVRLALKENATSDTTFYNYGIILKALRRPAEALERFSQALAINAEVAETWNNRGTVYNELKHYDDAIADFDKATALQPGYAAAYCNKGKALTELKRYDEAFAAYDRALTLKPDLAEAWLGRGNVLVELKRFGDALAAYDKAITFKPDLAEAWGGRGDVCGQLKRYDDALAAYDKTLALKPDLAEAWLGRGHIFADLKRHDDAFATYDKALALKPDLIGAEGARLHSKMCCCDWTHFDSERAHLISSVQDGKADTTPFFFLGLSSSADEQLQCAKVWAAKNHPPLQEPVWRGERCRHDRIRVAYVSADFSAHPMSRLMAGIFESHDKSRFDVTAISLGPDDNSELRQRLEASFERFIDAQKYGDDQIIDLVRSSEIDVLIDLMGFTRDSRTGLFARRPAPIQAIYLGYAGTMGAPYFDYILADRIVIPEAKRGCYTEKVVYLPNSFMANDSKRKISARPPRRSECGLPESGFVFCSFNQTYKITPQQFDIWMRLLRQLDDSVLWLSSTNETAVGNLRREARNRGVDAGRIVFAQPVSLNEDHLARQGLADLFLDTLPYNAHSTASDALWAGLPVLTCVGETYAGRVAASLLNAIDLPELITSTPDAYEKTAVDLATHPEKLALIKRKLADNRLTKPLFDTQQFTRHIEAAYAKMYERYQTGLAPDHIVISD